LLEGNPAWRNWKHKGTQHVNTSARGGNPAWRNWKFV